MKIINNIITEATEEELFAVYLEMNYDDIYSFKDYMEKCIMAGTKISKQ